MTSAWRGYTQLEGGGGGSGEGGSLEGGIREVYVNF